ncbi:MAG: TetR/AcrR family transcriptional regulator [Actinomycetota bacterium]
MPRPRMTDERRRQILEAAALVIAERGVCDARIADVAARIGTSPALILYYFPSKDALLAEAIAFRDQQFFDGVAQGLEEGASAASRLRRLIEASCPPAENLDRSDNEWLLWLDMWNRSRFDARLSEERLRMDAMFRSTIAEIVRQGVVSGEFESIDPSRFAVKLSALIDGLAIQVLLQDPAVSSAVMKGICLEQAAADLGAHILHPVRATPARPRR